VGDDHGAGVLLATRLLYNIGEELLAFIGTGKLVIAICNGFQAVVNLGLLPGSTVTIARGASPSSERLRQLPQPVGAPRGQPRSPCVFTQGLEKLELPVRHGEGKLYAEKSVIDNLVENNQVVLRYATATAARLAGASREPQTALWRISPASATPRQGVRPYAPPRGVQSLDQPSRLDRSKEIYRRRRQPYRRRVSVSRSSGTPSAILPRAFPRLEPRIFRLPLGTEIE